MKKADYIVCGSVCVFAAILAFLFIFIKSDGKTVVVEKNNKIVAEYPLDAERRVALEHNTFIISSGMVYMSDADCKNQICVKTGKISKKGECIVCLPNSVVIEIK